MAQAASLWVKLGLSTKEFDAGLRKAENDLNRFGNRLSGLGFKMTQGFTVPLGLAGVAAVKTAANMEVAEVAFSTLLGSVEKARKQMEALKNFAKTTPFQFDELTTATRRMLAFGFSVEQTIPMLRTIGDSVSALGVGSEGLNNIVTALGQMQMKGKVSAEEMTRQLGQYIPAWQYLANSLGITVAQAMKKAEQGMIDGATGVRAILEGLANDKRFVGGMEKQAQTLAGIWSNFKDTLSFTLADIGGTIVKTFDLKDKLTGLMEGLQKFSDWFANLNPTIRELAVNFTVFMAVLGPLVLIAGKLITSFSAVIGVLRLLPNLGIVKIFKDMAIYIGGAIKGAWSLSAAMGALSASFAPLLAGGAIIAGLVIIVDLFRRMSENARIAKLEISSINDLSDAMKKKTAVQSEVTRLENAKTAAERKDTKGGWVAGGIGSFSPEEEKKLEKAKEQLKQINALIEKLKNPATSATTDLEKSIKELLAGFGSNTLDTSGGFDLAKFISESKMKLTNLNAAAGFGLPTDVYDPLKEKYDFLNQAIQTLIQNGIDPASTALGDLISQQNDAVMAIINRRQAENEANAAIDAQTDANKNTTKETVDFSKQLSQASEILSGFSGPLAEFGSTVSGLVDSFLSAKEAFSKISFTKSETNPLGAFGGILNTIGVISGLIGTVTNVFDILTGAAARQQAAAEAQQKAAEEWRKFLDESSSTELFAKQTELNNQLNALQQQKAEAEQLLQYYKNSNPFGWVDSANITAKIQELNNQISDTQNKLAELPGQIKETLGITTSDLTSVVQNAFSKETVDDFIAEIDTGFNEVIRNAMITQFETGAIMKPLYNQLSDSIMSAIEDGTITAAEKTAMENIKDQITDRSGTFFDALEQMGLGLSDLTSTVNETTASLRNMPSGFKYATNQYAVAQSEYSYIPHYANGGSIPYTPGGRLIVAGENETEWVLNSQQMAAMGGGLTINVNAPVYGVNDLKTTIKTAIYEAQRQSSMSMAGVR